MCLASRSLFRGIPLKLKDYKNKNPNWRETDQLPIYKHEREVEQRSTEKQFQLSGQSGIWTRHLRISRVT